MLARQIECERQSNSHIFFPAASATIVVAVAAPLSTNYVKHESKTPIPIVIRTNVNVWE